MAKKGKVVDLGGQQNKQQVGLKLDPRKLETVSCPNCGAYVEVYWGENEIKEKFRKDGMYK